MSMPLRVLILEDSPTDAAVMVGHLREAGYRPEWKRVETEADFIAHLEPSLDLILADYTLPDFTAYSALQLLQARAWDIPTIVVTGTASEDVALECMRLGAADYLLKDRLARLGEAVGGALRQRNLRHQNAAAEEARQASEARAHVLADVLERSSQPFAVGYTDGRLGICNAAFCALVGYTEVELQAMDWSRDLTPPEWRTFEADRRAELHRTDQPVRYEKEYRRKDGTRVPVEALVHFVHDDDGAPPYYYSFVTDLTERHRAEQDLKTRTHQLEAVRVVGQEITHELDLPTLLRLILDRAVELVGAGQGMFYLWDDAAEYLIPQVWHGIDAWRKDLRLRLGEGVAGTVAKRRESLIVNDYRTSPFALPAVLAQTRDVAVLAEPLVYQEHLLGVVLIRTEELGRPFTVQDQAILQLFATHAAIALENARLYETIRRHAAELEQRVQERTRELEAANAELANASRHKSEFLANMSHELRTPLNSILGFSELLEEQLSSLPPEKQRRYLHNIHTSGKHLLQLINDILDISKVEAGKFVLQPERLAPAQVLEDILVIGRGLANKKGQTIATEIATDLPPLQADPTRLKQILFNLLSNAVKFTPAGGRITVSCRVVAASAGHLGEGRSGSCQSTARPPGQSAQSVEITVRDTGVGIRGADLSKLFREFMQLDTTRAQHHEGTGLGLALTKRLVDLHGGRLWAESEGEGLGSTFTLRLPLGEPGP
jgi:PAS domain S-box-containing protein